MGFGHEQIGHEENGQHLGLPKGCQPPLHRCGEERHSCCEERHSCCEEIAECGEERHSCSEENSLVDPLVLVNRSWCIPAEGMVECVVLGCLLG